MQDFKEFYHARIAWNQGQQPKVDEGKEEYIMKKGQFTRKVDGKTADKMKRQGWKLVAKEGIKIKESFAVFEAKMTPDQLKKREKIAKAIQRDNPDMPMDKKMAIATKAAMNEKASQGMFVVVQGSKYKVLGQFKDKKKAIDLMKKNPKSKTIQIGKSATVDGKPVDVKVGDEMSYTRFKLSTKIKESFTISEGRGPKIKDIKRKFKREIEKFQKGGDLDWKAENALLAWALEYTNDIKTDDADEMDDWLMDKIADKKSFDKLKESLDEALSDAEKKKRLAMIKKAVEKIDKKNMAKAKKDAMAMMKSSGMFDESSASWAKSLDDIAKKRQLDKISDKDKATLMKIAAMLAKEKK